MKKELNMKTGWHEVTIHEFMKVQELSVDDFPDELEYMIAVMEILSDKDRNYLYSLPINEVNTYMEKLQFIAETPHGSICDKYQINGVKYRATLNVKELSAIQYIDLVTLLKDNKDNRNLHLILAVILVPEGLEYNTKEYDVMKAAEEILHHFNIADAYALSLFFRLFSTL